MPSDGKKGLTVRIDEELHAEVRQYLESHEMTMAEFVTLALQNELHPKITMKEDKYMGNMRTLAVQIPEDLFQRIKDYLHRNNMTQKEFVIGLIENKLEREQTERESTDMNDSETVYEDSDDNAVEQDGEDFSDGIGDENEEAEENDEYESYDENEDGYEVSDYSEKFEEETEQEENADMSDSETVYEDLEDNAEGQDGADFSDGVRDENEEAEENDKYESYDEDTEEYEVSEGEDEIESENMGFSIVM